jgi:penicillin-insensitive murein endopeptidase
VRASRGRDHGHPALIAYLAAFAAEARALGWRGLLVGDLAQPRGGPMRSGHASHQTGLDVDIWYRPQPARALSDAERETIEPFSLVAANGRSVEATRWRDGYARLLATAARFEAVERIFVHPAIKQRLCGDTPTRAGTDAGADRAWLAKIRPWWGHDHHFHVRLRCPPGDRACDPQPPPPAGDGCGAELRWWFSAEAAARRKEQATRPPPPRLTLADLPAQCRGILRAQ